MSIESALIFAIQIIMNYESDIENCKKEFGVDLVKYGFCQGTVYKNALRIIEKKREEE